MLDGLKIGDNVFSVNISAGSPQRTFTAAKTLYPFSWQELRWDFGFGRRLAGY